MYILGIHGVLDAGAVLLKDGKIVTAINEERLNRKKLTKGFPVKSIEKIFELNKISARDIEFVAIQSKRGYFDPIAKPFFEWMEDPKNKIGAFKNNFLSIIAPIFGVSKCTWRLLQLILRIPAPLNRKKIKKFLRKRFGLTCPIYYIDHHYAHACSAYFTSGFDNAVVISMDGGGGGYSSRVYKAENGKLINVHNVNTYNSLGNFYAYITKLLGFKAHKHEGKITGLAAYGKPLYVDILKKFIIYKNGDIKNLSKSFMWGTLKKIKKALPEDYKREDVAASIQALLEEIAVKYCEYWIKKIGCNDVAVAGGVFANVKLNQRIHELDCIENIFIHPGMGDGGLAVGAAYALYAKSNSDQELKSQKIGDVYFGPEYSNEEIEAELKKDWLKYKYFEEIEKEIAKLLAKGQVVARFYGRMEYGPRALGNRSILYPATDPSVNDWLNKKLDRTEFMPFAPVTLKRFSDKCYNNFKGAEHTAKFMTITFDCTDFMKKNSPAVVHVDGTARPQIIDEETNQSYNKILEEYYKIAKLPTIVNTSFNMHEEPIVCSPYDAIRAFQLGHLDYLAMGNFLISNGGNNEKSQGKCYNSSI